MNWKTLDEKIFDIMGGIMWRACFVLFYAGLIALIVVVLRALPA